MSGQELRDIDAAAVAAARDWLGTPYVHQAACRGAGADCLGLICGIWRELYGAEPQPVPPYTPDWAEAGRDEPLMRAAARWLLPCDGLPIGPGQVLVFRMREGAIAKHLGLASAPGRFIHAYDRCGVIETALTEPWARRIAARFRFPG